MKAASERVARALQAVGIEVEIVEFAQSTRTAEEAAQAIGTEVGQIVKSLVFAADGEPLLALVSGSNRASLPLLASVVGAAIGRADAAMVRAATGYAIGGVPPVGLATIIPVLMDEDLLGYDVVYAAAGTPNSVFPIDPRALARITAARVVGLKDTAEPKVPDGGRT